MAFVTAAELKTRVQAMLKQLNLADVASSYDVHVPDSAEAAKGEIISAFLARGLTAAQAETWSRAKEFSIDLGLFWTFTKAAALHDFDDKWIIKLDRRAELKTVFLADEDGEVIVPEEVGSVLHGTIKQHPLDVFTVPGSKGRDGAGDYKRT